LFPEDDEAAAKRVKLPGVRVNPVPRLLLPPLARPWREIPPVPLPSLRDARLARLESFLIEPARPVKLCRERVPEAKADNDDAASEFKEEAGVDGGEEPDPAGLLLLSALVALPGCCDMRVRKGRREETRDCRPQAAASLYQVVITCFPGPFEF
jgi:hypothetical protein